MNRQLTIPEKVLAFATTLIGLQEIVGEEDNPKIVQMFKDIGFSWIKDDETAWCSCVINYIALQLNLVRSGKLTAKSWLGVGDKIKNPVPGDLVVFYRGDPNGWKGHVAVFLGFNKNGDVFSLGGNQGNEFNVSIYSKEKVLGYRRLQNE